MTESSWTPALLPAPHSLRSSSIKTYCRVCRGQAAAALACTKHQHLYRVLPDMSCITGRYTPEQIQQEYSKAMQLAQGPTAAVGVGLLNFLPNAERVQAIIQCHPRAAWLAAGNIQPACQQLTTAGPSHWKVQSTSMCICAFKLQCMQLV